MICPACRERKHGDCPELARQKAASGITALGSQWCECQHQESRDACGFCGVPLSQSPEPECLGQSAHAAVTA